MAQWKFVEWLLYWIFEAKNFEFDWDQGNRNKNKTKHDLTIEEVESVFKMGLALPLGIQIHPKTEEQRFGLVGPTRDNRVLQIAFTFRGSKVRVISARPAHRKERAEYEKILREIQKGI